MKKNVIRLWSVLAIVLIVYNIIVFAAPFEKTPVFFLSWIFTLAAMGAQIYTIRTAFCRDGNVRSKFYGFPIARIGIAYLTLQLLLGLCFMALGSRVALWVPLILYAVLLGAAAVGFIAADAVRGEVAEQDEKLQKNVECMRSLQSKAASLIPLAKDEQTRKVLEKFSEDLRFSDPVSSEALKDIEADLVFCVDELQQAVADGDGVSVLALEQKAASVLMERNRLCKLDKKTVH
ncbi:MAG: hypothetical protein HFH25_07010 [Lachnospiraceae bacterium]|nr:hypothetical protein [Lachnospiraceae bacterium]